MKCLNICVPSSILLSVSDDELVLAGSVQYHLEF